MSTRQEVGPSRYGLWRLMGDGDVRLERVYCADGHGIVPEITHAALPGQEKAVCGRRIRLHLHPHDTDSISQIDCKNCVEWIHRYTR